MSINKRKLGFYSLELCDKTNQQLRHNTSIISDMLEYLLAKRPKNRIYEIAHSKKFHFLDNVDNSKNKSISNLIFKSAKYYHRPPLIKRENANERANPKDLDEGETETTHIGLKYSKDTVVIVLEERSVGINIRRLIEYFKYFLKEYFNQLGNSIPFNLEFGIIAKRNFLTELNKLKRVRVASLKCNKQLIGDEFLSFAERAEEVNEEINIILKAKRYRSIKTVVRDIYYKMAEVKSNINRLTVRGYNDSGNSVLLDTEIVKKIEYIEVEVDELTGTVNSKKINQEINKVLNEM